LSEFWLGAGDSNSQVFKASHWPFGYTLSIKLIEIFCPREPVE
jgi:hypothetical protein